MPHENFLTIIQMSVMGTIFLVIAVIVILWRARALEVRLILIGVFMAMAAALFGGGQAAVSAGSGQGAILVGSPMATLGKIATILILSGVVLAIWWRAIPQEPASTEGGSHGA